MVTPDRRWSQRVRVGLIVGASLASAGAVEAQMQGPPVIAPPSEPPPHSHVKRWKKPVSSHADPATAPKGTLGYGPPGLHPGYQGFSLGFHPGYGYGEGALGVGAEGGYPLYGGPGYTHPGPALRRVGGIAPFAFAGAPACPQDGFAPVGPLVNDPHPVAQMDHDPSEVDPLGGYGGFTGVLPYPETTFSPASDLGERPNDEGPDPASPTLPPPAAPLIPADVPGPPGPLGLAIGLETETVADAGDGRSLRVRRVVPGSPAAKLGLKPGDLIRAANGVRTERPGQLEYLLATTPPGRPIDLAVRSDRDGAVRTVSAVRSAPSGPAATSAR